MLSLLPPTPRNLALLARYQDRHELYSAVIQAWRTGSPVLAECPQCHGPAVVVDDYLGGLGTHSFADCLVAEHRTPLNCQDENDLTIALHIDYRHDRVPTHPVYDAATAL